MNEALKAIANRYSCRSFDGKMPDGDAIKAIAEAAVSAPSGMNRRPWRVIVVKDTSLINELDAEGMAILKAMPDKSAYDRMMARGGKLFYNAPCMMVVALEDDGKGGSAMDCGIVVQNIAIAATSLGVDNIIVGMMGVPLGGDRGEEFKKRLCFPDGHVFGIAILLGYADKKGEPNAPALNKLIFVD